MASPNLSHTRALLGIACADITRDVAHTRLIAPTFSFMVMRQFWPMTLSRQPSESGWGTFSRESVSAAIVNARVAVSVGVAVAIVTPVAILVSPPVALGSALAAVGIAVDRVGDTAKQANECSGNCRK
jgi:hypothetical protein